MDLVAVERPGPVHVAAQHPPLAGTATHSSSLPTTSIAPEPGRSRRLPARTSQAELSPGTASGCAVSTAETVPSHLRFTTRTVAMPLGRRRYRAECGECSTYSNPSGCRGHERTGPVRRRRRGPAGAASRSARRAETRGRAQSPPNRLSPITWSPRRHRPARSPTPTSGWPLVCRERSALPRKTQRTARSSNVCTGNRVTRRDLGRPETPGRRRADQRDPSRHDPRHGRQPRAERVAQLRRRRPRTRDAGGGQTTGGDAPPFRPGEIRPRSGGTELIAAPVSTHVAPGSENADGARSLHVYWGRV